MSIPDEIYAITDNADGSITLAIDGVNNTITNAQVTNVSTRDESVFITESSGKTWKIWNWANEQNLGASSADNLRVLIAAIVYA